MNGAVEIRSYTLKPGSRSRFHAIFVETAHPMLKRFGIDVVDFGPSLHDENSYYLIRAFASLDDRQQKEDLFYGSNEWQNGPREEVLSLIDQYTTVVLEAREGVIDALRRGGSA